MADKNIFKLEGKSQEQVKKAFLEFLKIDKTKPGGYASVGSNKVICKVAKEACGVNSVLEIKKVEDATEVSKLLTGRIGKEEHHPRGSTWCGQNLFSQKDSLSADWLCEG